MSESENQGCCFKMRLIEYHDFKTLMGPCLISFSIPLLIPGVVLTVVGSYGNEHTFSTFGGWHIAGIFILALAVIMLTFGIILKCCFQPIISADIEEHLSPRSSMITGSQNLGYEKEHDRESIHSGGSRGTRKVAHYDSGNKNNHRVVSTHEAKGSNNDINERFVAANGVLAASNSKNTAQNKARLSDTNNPNMLTETGVPGENTKALKKKTRKSSNTSITQGAVSDENATHHTKTADFDHEPPPPNYDEIYTKPSRKKHSNNSDSETRTQVRETHQGVDTTVTTTITARAGSKLVRDSSDENTEFLPDKKKRKKKKRRRSRSSELTAGGSDVDTPDSARTELPELRMKPVLLHEGEPHHHQNLHVHFESEPSIEQTPESKDVCPSGTHSDSEIKS